VILLRTVAGIAFFVLLITLVDWGQLHNVVQNLNIFWASLGVLSMAVMRLVGAYKWHLLIRDQSDNIGLAQSIRMVFMSDFLSSFLPAGIGSDATRSVLLTRMATHRVVGVSSVFMDRMIGTWVMFVLAGVGLFASPIALQHRNAIAALLGSALVASVLGLTLLLQRRDSMVRRAARIPGCGPRVGGQMNKLMGSLERYRSNPQLLLQVALLTFGVHALRIAISYIFALAVGDHTSILVHAAFVPIIFVMNQLPITIDSLGIREVFYVYLFGLAGMPSATSFAVALLTRVAGYLLRILGAMLYIKDGLCTPARLVRQEKTTTPEASYHLAGGRRVTSAPDGNVSQRVEPGKLKA
jgi:hypothetical protein